MRPLIPRLLRLLLSGKGQPFVFDRQPVIWPSQPTNINLYIHLPFCRQICPFCPYVKELYNPVTSNAYQEALIRALDDLPPKVVPTTELELPAFWLQVPVADNQVSYVA